MAWEDFFKPNKSDDSSVQKLNELKSVVESIEKEYKTEPKDGNEITVMIERALVCLKTMDGVVKDQNRVIAQLKEQKQEDPKPVEKPTEKPTEKPAEKPTEKPVVVDNSADIKRLEELVTKQLEAMTRTLDTVKGRTGLIQDSLAGQVKSLMESEQTKQSRLEEVIQNCQEDRVRKDKARLIKRSIYQMMLIRKTIYDFENEETFESDADKVRFLLEQLSAVLTFSEATIEQEQIERVEPAKEGDTINLEQQEVIGYHATDNAELDGKIFRSVNPAYVWRLPYILKAKLNDKGDEIKTYRFLLESEQVIMYKLNNNN